MSRDICLLVIWDDDFDGDIHYQILPEERPIPFLIWSGFDIVT